MTPTRPVSATEVKRLRDATGAGMMECKRALSENDGDFERAREALRVRGAAKADKVSGRAAAEGRVASALSGGRGAMVEVNSETDFVARQDEFGQFASAVATALAEAGTVPDDLGELHLQCSGKSAEESRRELVMRVGENVVLRRGKILPGGSAFYIHAGDRIGVVAAVSGGSDELSRDVCMHIAAMNPRYVGAGDVSESFVASEKAVFAKQAEESGKPPEIAAKMAEGKMKKRLSEVCLLEQPFVKDSDATVGALLKKSGAEVSGFLRMTVGAEGEFDSDGSDGSESSGESGAGSA